jgi:hypothetical protein
MKILAFERELGGATKEMFHAYAQAEAARVWELYQADVIREVYFHAERDVAILVLECVDIASAQEQLGTLPFVRSGLIVFDLIPLKPYPGFERLFGGAVDVRSGKESL